MYTIEDLELAACSLITVSSSIEQIHKALESLKIVLQQRELINIPKVCIQSIAAYDYKQECQTVDELDGIKDDRDRIFIETLLIRERIFLSRKDITIIQPLQAYGDMLVDREEFDKCLDVWIHTCYLYQQMKLCTSLHRFVWLFCRMLRTNKIISIERFLQVCQLVFEPFQTKYRTSTLCNILFLVIIATKILEQEGITKEEQTSIYCWVQDLCHHRLTGVNGTNLLHVCVDVQTNSMLNFRPMDITPYLKFPNESGLRLLLACGSRWLDLNASESSDKDTPLHIICKGKKDRQIIKLLLNSGCHMDCVNKNGKIPMDYIEDKEIRALFMPKPTSLNLKCLCARIIANKQLNTECLGQSTSVLNKFIMLHDGSSHIQSNSD